MWKKTYRSASGFNWQREADKRIGCQSTSLHHLTPSLFSAIEDEILEEIGHEEGIDGYLLRVEVENADLKKVREIAAKNPSPYIVLHIVGEHGEEYRGREGEKLTIQDPADYIVEQNIYFNYPAIPALNQTKPPKKEDLHQAISSLIYPHKEKTSPFLESILGSYLEDSWDLEELQRIFPALQWMIRRIGDSSQGLELLPFLKSFLKIPYGLPHHTIHLFFAFTTYYYGERLWSAPNPKALGESLIRDASFFYQLIEGHYPEAKIYLRDLTAKEKKYSASIHSIFSGEREDLLSSYNALTKWWHHRLPPISRQKAFYEGEAVFFAQRLRHLTFLGYTIFLNKDLPEIFSQVEKGLKRVKEEIEKTPERILHHLREEIEEIFSIGIWSWYQALNSYQLDPDSPWQDRYTLALLETTRKSKGEMEAFLSQLLASFGIPPVFDWERDERGKFFQILKRAKGRLDQFKTSIPLPIFQVTGEKGEGNTYYFQDFFLVTIRPPKKGLNLYVTYNGEDPRRETAKREVKRSTYQHRGEEETIMKITSGRDGYYGEVVSLHLKDALKDYNIRVKDDLFTRAGASEPEGSFVLTIKPKGIERTLRSLFSCWLERGAPKNLLERLALDVLESLKERE